MLKFGSSTADAPSRPNVGRLWVLACAVFAFSALGLSRTVVAAGCDYAHSGPITMSGGQAGMLPEWGAWTTGPVQRVYSGGSFQYYQVSSDVPCTAPECQGSVPESKISMPATVPNDRQVAQAVAASSSKLVFVSSGRFVSTNDAKPLSPTLDGPLRPPCC